MEMWVVKSLHDETVWKLEKRSHRPSNAVGLAIEDGQGGYEDPEWLQLELVDDGQGNMIETLTIDEVKKAEILQQRIDFDLERDAEKQLRNDKVIKQKSDIANFDKKKVNSVAEIKDTLELMMKLIEELHSRVVRLEE